MKINSRPVKCLAYVVGMCIACSTHEWLFGVLFGVVGLLAVIPETIEYTRYIVFASAIYLLANFSIVHVIETMYLLAAFVVFSDYNIRSTKMETLAPYILSIACLVTFQMKGLIVPVSALAIYAVYLLKRYDPRVLVGCAIILLTFSAYELAVANVSEANRIAIYSYYFLVLGVFAELIDEIRNSHGRDNAVDQSTND